MSVDSDNELTSLLQLASQGNRDAAEKLFQLVHGTLRRIARQRMRSERRDHTLQATALVNEAWIKLIGDEFVAWPSRGQFFGAAALAMRHILIDHARGRACVKRGGNVARASLDVAELASDQNPQEMLALDEAIARLEKEEPDVGAVVRLRFFAGLTIDETAATLGVAPRHVDRLWKYARARLYRMLKDHD